MESKISEAERVFSSEAMLQSFCFQRFWNEYPKFRGRLFCVNNNSKDAIQGNRNKAMGVIAGVSDMVFVGERFVAFLELKLKNRVQSTAQKDWEKLVSKCGHIYILIKGELEFKETLDNLTKLC